MGKKYCSYECPIGQEYVPEVKVKELSQIVLQVLATMNSLEKAKDRFIEITADGEISEDEFADFAKINRERCLFESSVIKAPDQNRQEPGIQQNNRNRGRIPLSI